MSVARILTDLRCNGGETVAFVRATTLADQLRTIDHRDRLHLRLSEWEWCLAEIDVARVIQLADYAGDTYEWRISGFEDVVGEGSGQVAVTADPIFLDLATEIIREQFSGGSTQFNLGFDGLTVAQIIDTWVIPALHAGGKTYIQRGTIETTEPVTLSWSAYSCLELIIELARLTGMEWRLRPNGTTDYRIDFLARIGANGRTPRAAVARNLIHLSRTFVSDELRNVIIPFGQTVPGAAEPSTIAQASWKVDSVSGSDIVLSDRAGGVGPIAFDGQLDGLYLLKRNGTLTEITDSVASTQTITVASAANVAVGDDVEFRADSSGGLITELLNPTSVAAYGRRVGTAQDDDWRAERNYIHNPFFGDWPDKPLVYAGRLDGSHSAATSANIKDLPLSQPIAENDVLYLGTGSNRVRRITADATISGTGTVTVSVASGFSAPADTYVYIVRTGGRFPAGYEPSGVFATAPHVLMHRSRAVSGVLNADVDGAHDFSGLDSVKRLAVDGLTSGDEVHPGDEIWPTSSRATAVVLSPATADGGGAAVLTVHSGSSFANNASIEIRRPAIASEGGDDAVVLPCLLALNSPSSNAVRQSVAVRYTPGLTTLWARAGVTVRRSGVNSSATIAMERGGTTEPPRLILSLTGHFGPNAGGTVYVPDTDLVPGDEFDTSLAQQAVVQANTTATMDVRGPWTTSTTAEFDPMCYVRFLALALTSDPDFPPIWGSHATKGWQRGNRYLQQHSEIRTLYRVRYADLSLVSGFDPLREAPELGSDLLITSPDQGLRDEPARIVEIQSLGAGAARPFDPAKTSVVLEVLG